MRSTAVRPNSESADIMKVVDVQKAYRTKVGMLSSLLGSAPKSNMAVDHVNLTLRLGEVLGLVGESGSGKTTLGKLMTMLEPITEGSIVFDGVALETLSPRRVREMRKHIQMVFQDPYESLDPRTTVLQTLEEPLMVQGIRSSSYRDRAAQALETVGLRPPGDFLDRFPHELSGGQRQRVAVARAIIVNPDFIVADEPVSMMDASVRAGVMNMMLKLNRDFNMTTVFITHDLAVARYMSDKIAIMYLGQIVEVGDTELIINNPAHPYTRILLSAVPVPDPSHGRSRVTVPGEIPSGFDKPSGCYFHPRCPFAEDVCKEKAPETRKLPNGTEARCHFAEDMLELNGTGK